MAAVDSRPLRLTADAVRVLVLFSAVAVALTAHDGAVMLSMLFLVVLVPRVTLLPAGVDLLVCAVLTWATWSAVGRWYRVADWYDTLVHSVTPGVVAVALHLLLARWRLLPAPGDRALRRAAVPLITAGVGAVVAVLWELYEGLATQVFEARIPVGYTDTLVDLAVGTGGSVLAGIVVAARANRRSSTT
ncbi:hypothetical protein ACIQ6R_35130 [Streptomyces sp. NPDC096048]|uniref:hypothetical protein n=1 Tax=Streptomyces sp. NPDC096048 TaxID=3366072 RepID=UPI00382DDA8E